MNTAKVVNPETLHHLTSDGGIGPPMPACQSRSGIKGSIENVSLRDWEMDAGVIAGVVEMLVEVMWYGTPRRLQHRMR